MPIQLMIVYRVMGVLFLVLAGAALWEKYRTVRGAVLLPGRILDCRKGGRTSPRKGAGGYRRGTPGDGDQRFPLVQPQQPQGQKRAGLV